MPDMQEAVMRDLVGTDRELIETHISWVVLDEHTVWKIKKPADLGFVDFTDREVRRAACNAEVHLNRRLAPDVYRSVVPVTSAAGRLDFAGLGEVVDWAVEMRRLPDRDRADVRLAEGRLGFAEVSRIARRIAAFHREAAGGPAVTRHGMPETIEELVAENFSQMREPVSDLVTVREAREAERQQRSFVEAHRSWFEARVASGRIVDGHGDLRLEHIYIDDDGRIRIIDCVEFSERLRSVDVVADLAFAAMELADQGRVDLGDHLVARYAELTGDFELYRGLDFYIGYRAHVRAKIDALMADDASLGHDRRAEARARARRHFLLTLASERPQLLPPRVFAVGGWIAAGKSSIASLLSRRTGAPVVNSDRTRKQLLDVGVHRRIADNAWSGAYAPEMTRRVYEEMIRRAEAVLAAGRPVILDASFRKPEYRELARALAERASASFHFIECTAPRDLCKKRLRKRQRAESVSDGRVEIFDDFVARYDPPTELPPAQRIRLDTSAPLQSCSRELFAALPVLPIGLTG